MSARIGASRRPREPFPGRRISLHPFLDVLVNLLLAWGAGAAIGFERSFNGRAAGFRTHALVAVAASSVMALSYITGGQGGLGGQAGLGGAAPRLDPSHLAQGVVTGIGFLGAGVIFKEGVSVQGLTTAASIWATAAMAMLFGVGMRLEAASCLIVVLATLTILRWVEAVVPWRVYALAVFRFHADKTPSAAELEELLGGHDVVLGDLSYSLKSGGEIMEYRADLATRRAAAFNGLSERLRNHPGLFEFELSRISK
jgi:putative Mg2+ transporter-C (MgtC) family protein